MASPIAKSVPRGRRTKAMMRAIRDAAIELLAEEWPMTVRQLYYRLVSAGVIEKTEAEYKMLVRVLGLMRRAGEIPFKYITDGTRWMRRAQRFDSVESGMRIFQTAYRRDEWNDQPFYVEIWIEKDGLSGVLEPEADRYGVPIMPTRGYPSISFLHSAAAMIGDIDKPTFIYYFGDFDPSGMDIPRKVERGLREFAPKANITFVRVAVNEQQIAELGLPTRPTKMTDSRSKNFGDRSVEVDAIPPATLREMVRNCIEQHLDQERLKITRVIEESERDDLEKLFKSKTFKGLFSESAA